MNKKIITEAEKRRFKQILEYTNYGSQNYLNDKAIIDEEGDDENQDEPAMDDNMGGTPAPEGGMPQDGGMMPGGDMSQGGDTMPPMDNQMGGGEIPQQDGDMQQGGGQTPEGFNPQDMGGDLSQNDFEGGVNPDDDVIDVSDLTDAQEDTEESVEQLGDKFDKVLKYLGQWEEMIKSNNEKIENLAAEFEKRNPTQVEKLSMQTANSYPFNVKPEDYWKEKEATSNYRTEYDDNGKEQGQYVITKNDVDGITDWKGIADSLDDDAIYHPTLKNTMGNW